jgi:hypothetical protein
MERTNRTPNTNLGHSSQKLAPRTQILQQSQSQKEESEYSVSFLVIHLSSAHMNRPIFLVATLVHLHHTTGKNPGKPRSITETCLNVVKHEEQHTKAHNLQTTKLHKKKKKKRVNEELQLPQTLMITNCLQLWHFLPITFYTRFHPLWQTFYSTFQLGHIHIVKNLDTGPHHTSLS